MDFSGLLCRFLFLGKLLGIKVKGRREALFGFTMSDMKTFIWVIRKFVVMFWCGKI